LVGQKRGRIQGGKRGNAKRKKKWPEEGGFTLFKGKGGAGILDQEGEGGVQEEEKKGPRNRDLTTEGKGLDLI